MEEKHHRLSDLCELCVDSTHVFCSYSGRNSFYIVLARVRDGIKEETERARE
jgi:hypothetical protein